MSEHKGRSLAEWVVASVLVAAWGVVVTTHVYQAFSGSLTWTPFGVTSAATAADFPVLRDFLPGTDGETGDLEVGDRILSVGVTSVRGFSALELAAATVAQGRQGDRLEVTYRRQGTQDPLSTQIRLPGLLYPWWRALPVLIGFIIPIALVLWRAPSSPTRRNLFLGSIFYVLLWARVLGGPAEITYLGFAIFALAAAVAWPLIIRGALLFPEETTADSAWKKTWPWIFAIGAPLGTSSVYGIPFSYSFAMKAVCAFGAAFCLTVLCILAVNYGRSDAISRRRIKWVVFTFYLGIVPELFAAAAAAVSTDYFWLAESTVAATAVAPLGLFVAIVRYNLFDIDRVLSATATYSILTFSGIAAIVYLAPVFAERVAALAGIDPALGQMAASVALAGIWIGSHRYVRPVVNRLFFAEQYALERTVSDLLTAIREAADEDELYRLSGTGLSRISQSEDVAIYSKEPDGYVRRYPADGDTPTRITPDDPLYSIIEKLRTTIIEESTGWRLGTGGGPLERAVLEMLGLAVLIPNLAGGGILGFMGLTRKTSRDIFTHTDVTHFEMLGGQFAYELVRLRNAREHKQLLEHQRQIVRYLPEAVSKRILAGETVESGDYDLTVLFVDIRSYTSYAEARRPDEVFSLINEYATGVYGIVRDHGGAVVQFQGDGLMAVFGAPLGTEDKEAQAVRAALQVVAELSPHAAGSSGQAGPSIRLGVGIATGPAHLGTFGSMQSAVWSAVGHPVNLAYRLEEITKQLGAVVVTDSDTWTRAKGAGLGFERVEHVDIRGLSQAYDLYVLRLP